MDVVREDECGRGATLAGPFDSSQRNSVHNAGEKPTAAIKYESLVNYHGVEKTVSSNVPRESGELFVR
jgi:hypothetical protein